MSVQNLKKNLCSVYASEQHMNDLRHNARFLHVFIADVIKD